MGCESWRCAASVSLTLLLLGSKLARCGGKLHGDGAEHSKSGSRRASRACTAACRAVCTGLHGRGRLSMCGPQGSSSCMCHMPHGPRATCGMSHMVAAPPDGQRQARAPGLQCAALNARPHQRWAPARGSATAPAAAACRAAAAAAGCLSLHGLVAAAGCHCHRRPEQLSAVDHAAGAGVEILRRLDDRGSTAREAGHERQAVEADSTRVLRTAAPCGACRTGLAGKAGDRFSARTTAGTPGCRLALPHALARHRWCRPATAAIAAGPSCIQPAQEASIKGPSVQGRPRFMKSAAPMSRLHHGCSPPLRPPGAARPHLPGAAAEVCLPEWHARCHQLVARLADGSRVRARAGQLLNKALSSCRHLAAAGTVCAAAPLQLLQQASQVRDGWRLSP